MPLNPLPRTLIALLLCLAFPAFAADRNPSAELGLGLGLLAGGNGAGYGLGASQRLGVDVPAGPIHSVVVAVEHAHHVLQDATAYFPNDIVSPDALEGGRDRWALSLGARLQLQLADPAADHLVVEPLAEVGMAFVASHTVLTLGGLDGAARLGNWDGAPAFFVGMGADVRVRTFLALVPALRVTIALQQDPPENGGQGLYGAEVRGDLSLSARVTF